MSKKNKNKKLSITIKDYLKAVKKADREIQLSDQPGWRRTTSIHKNKKAYNRRNNKKDFTKDEE